MRRASLFYFLINYFSISMQVWWVTLIVVTLYFLLEFISTEKCLMCVVNRWRHLLTHTNNFSLIFFWDWSSTFRYGEGEREGGGMLRFLCYALRLKFSLCAQGNSFFNLFIFDSLPSHIKNIWRVSLSLSLVFGWVGWLHRYFAYTHAYLLICI